MAKAVFENFKRGGVNYSSPVCEIVNLDFDSTICNQSGSFPTDQWKDDDLGLTF